MKSKMKKGQWTFLTNHGRVLVYIAKYPQSTEQEIAQDAGLSIRAVQQIVTHLVEGGYIIRDREGRRNRYTVHPEMPMRHRLERDHAVGDILFALGYDASKEQGAGNETTVTLTRA